VAATGFGLAALPIAVENGAIPAAEATETARRCLRSLLAASQAEAPDSAGAHGFLYHFLDARTCRRHGACEISSVDTALLVVGALACGQYMARLPGGEDVRDMAQALADRVEWPWMYDPATGFFRMGWRPEKGLEGAWDYYTDEVLLICLLAAGSRTHTVPPDCAWAWRREKGAYGGQEVVQSWFGTMFSYLFCGLFVDLRGLTDRHPGSPTNWWENARSAALANAAFCRDHAREHFTYGAGRWGLSACLGQGPAQGEERYDGDYGAAPCGSPAGPHHDGTLAPYGAAMCLPLFGGAHNLAAASLWSFWRDCPRLWGAYGFRDGCNLGPSAGPEDDWYAHDYVAVCQGPLLLGIADYRTGLIWRLTSAEPRISAGRRLLFGR
jgi:hypothetical protein